MSGIYMGIIVPATILLPLIAALWRCRQWTAPEKVIFVYLLISGVFNAIATLLSNRGINNLPFLHVYTLIEFWIISGFFRLVLTDERERLGLLALQIAFPLLALINVLWVGSLSVYNMLARSVEAILLILFCCYYLARHFYSTGKQGSNFSLLIVVGLLLYFSGSVSLFALSEYVVANRELNNVIWNLHATFVLVMYLIFTAAYLQKRFLA